MFTSGKTVYFPESVICSGAEDRFLSRVGQVPEGEGRSFPGIGLLAREILLSGPQQKGLTVHIRTLSPRFVPLAELG